MLLLDTHAFIWLASDRKQLPAATVREIKNAAEKLYISSISVLEIGMLVKRKRLSLPMPPADFVDTALSHHGVHEMTVDRAIALRSAELPDIHDDPFDRIIIATAMLHGMRIITRDTHISSYPGVHVTWA